MRETLLVLPLSALAAAIQGSIGFGNALLMAPLLALVDPAFVPAPLLIVALPLSLLVAWRERESVDYRGLPWAIGARVPGIAAGAAAVAVVPERRLQVIVAVCVLVAVGLSLVPSIDVRPSPLSLSIAGLASGFMATAASVGGPPIALLYQRESGSRIRATLGFYFVFGTIMSLVGLRIAGHAGLQELRLAGELLPGTFIGFALSGRARGLLDGGLMRTAVLVFAALSSVVLLVSAAA